MRHAALVCALHLAQCGEIEPEVSTGLAACEDGVDNDGDERTDFPDDPGCQTPGDPAEGDPSIPRQCSDGLDNDGDGFVDFMAGTPARGDQGCESAADDDESNITLPQCGDFVDNDGDGAIDLQDGQCENGNDQDEAS